MNTKVSTALQRLESIHPLSKGLKSLSRDEVVLYCMLLNSYVQQGRALTRNEATELLKDAELALVNIARNRLIVLDAEGNPSGAYPFTSEQREHRVHINGTAVHCMCALDALAVSPMFNIPTIIGSQCRVTGEAIHLEQQGTDSLTGTVSAWFGIDWGAAATDSVCADSLCMEMLFLANRDVAYAWLAESPHSREVFDLPSAVAFATGFFVPLAEHCRSLN